MANIQKIREISDIVLDELCDTHSKVKDILDTDPPSYAYELRGRLTAPFVAFAETSNGPLYLCYGYTPGHFPKRGGLFVSYYAAVGKVFSVSPGGTIAHNGKTWQLHLKHDFQPVRTGVDWDAIQNTIVDVDGASRIRSLRQLLQQHPPAVAAETPSRPAADIKKELEIVAQREKERLNQENISQLISTLKRDRLSLKGKYILNIVQDAVMRTELSENIILEGLPGTGKTTTIVKLIANQCYYDPLGSGNRLVENKTWRLYVPTEILKDYVREAFNKESIPATSQIILTWDDDERMFFARDIFSFLKMGDSKGFRIVRDGRNDDGPTISRKSSEMLSVILASLCEELKIKAETEADAGKAFQSQASEYISYYSERNSAIAAISEKYNWYFSGVEERVAVIPGLGEESIPQTLHELSELSSDEFLTLYDSYNAYREALRLKADSQGKTTPKVIYGEDTNVQKISALIARKKSDLIKISSGLLSPRAHQVAEVFYDHSALPTDQKLLKAYRDAHAKLKALPKHAERVKDLPEYLAALYITQVGKHKNDKVEILDWEVDTIIYGLLALLSSFPSTTKSELLSQIRERIVDKIVIDEASDFSAVQVRILKLLCKHGLVLSGDLMQRATSHGLQSWEEPKLPFRKHTLTTVYRQNPRLLAVAKEVHRISTGEDLAFQSEYPENVEYPAPYLLESPDESKTLKWICEDIVKAYQADGDMPPTAIFVHSRAEIDRVSGLLEPLLNENALQLERCYEGRMSPSKRIGVFEYRHIKGLEFEAAYLVNPDLLAESLFGRHVYIGATRATRYLRVICRELPQKYKGIKGFFTSFNL